MAAPRALVVEDETLIALMLEDLLTEAGCDVAFAAASLAEGRAIARDEALDLALLDLRLGNGQDSLPIAELLQQRGIPFAFVTAEGRAGLGGRFPGAPVLQKPFRPDEIRDLLTALLAPGSAPAAAHA